MSLSPRPYTDGKDRIVVRVIHKLDREQFIRTLALAYDQEHCGDDMPKPLKHARALHLVRMELAIEGHFGGEGYLEPAWLEWATAEADRLWPTAGAL